MCPIETRVVSRLKGDVRVKISETVSFYIRTRFFDHLTTEVRSNILCAFMMVKSVVLKSHPFYLRHSPYKEKKKRK